MLIDFELQKLLKIAENECELDSAIEYLFDQYSDDMPNLLAKLKVLLFKNMKYQMFLYTNDINDLNYCLMTVLIYLYSVKNMNDNEYDTFLMEYGYLRSKSGIVKAFINRFLNNKEVNPKIKKVVWSRISVNDLTVQLPDQVDSDLFLTQNECETNQSGK